MYRFLVLIFSTLVLVPPAFAQNVGTISGSVRDTQGLAIPGATVTLANRVSQASQNTVSDQDGRYALNNVPFGTYVLTVSLSGFAPAEQVVELRSSVPIARDLQLKIGALSETVTVSADALLETSAAGSHVDIGASLIEQLPTATPTKQLSAMLLSAPGFIPSQNGRVHVRGSHGQIQYVVDGVPLTDEYSEAFANPLDPRYVKSAEVMTGGIPAEYGGKLAAVVDITSKSGLDEPRSVFGNATLNVGRFNALDGGVTVGGRISPKVGYFLSGGGNRTDRYLDPPTTDNFHNDGHAERFTGKLELRPTDADFVRAVVSVNGSHFQVPNRPDAQADGVDATQDLRDNSQTVTWLHQFGGAATMDVVAYRRSADAKLDGLVADAFSASQDRSLDHQGVNASVSATSGMHRFKAGVQYDRNPVAEHFLMNGRFLAVNFITFDGSRTGQNVGVFAQDTITPVPDLHVSLGVRFDRYKLIVEESAVSPRIGVAYHVHDSGTVFRASYNRIFMPPFSENLLLSSSPQARALAADPNDAGEDLRSERQHAFEAGVQQALGTRAKLDVAYYRKDMRNVADVDQFFDTTVTFPISVDKGLAQGVEARLDVPMHHGVGGYVSLSRATILLTAPLSGGLFLGAVPAPGEQFYADHDQRWQSQFGLSFEHPSRRLFGSVSGRFDSGIPFELPEDFDARTFEDPKALTLIDIDRGRAKPRAIFDAVVGSELYRHGSTKLEAQAGVLNLFDKTYLLNFLSIFNGTHYGAPRTWTARIKVGF
jgi:TonB dependent receptor/Carboxypeptidase regulatory-like domain/TonB-dependent Receptor Plug Domain